jgi:hypothetical protein
MNTTDEGEQRGGSLTRREFLTRPFAGIAREWLPSGKGKPIPCRLRLEDLRFIPDAVLLEMTPVLRQNWTARVSEAGVTYQSDAGQKGIAFLGREGCTAARMFDGVRTLEQIAAALEAELGMASVRCRAIVRETFLILAEREIYHPNWPPGTPPTPPSAKDSCA